MRLVYLDNETHLIKPGLSAPQVVCTAFIDDAGEHLYLRDEALDYAEAALEDENAIIVGHQVYYDLGGYCAEDPRRFVPLVFRAFEQFRVRDTIVRQQLIDISQGDLKYHFDEASNTYVKTGYTLQDLARRVLQRELQKEGTWRLKYALLDGVPVADWPQEARDYCYNDVRTTRDVFLEQVNLAGGDESVGGHIPTEDRSTREAWALWLMSCWGVRTDADSVSKLRAELEAGQKKFHEKLATTGFFKPDGKKHMKVIYERVEAAYKAGDKPLPRTGTGRPKTEHEVLEEAPCPACGGAGKSGTQSLLENNCDACRNEEGECTGRDVMLVALAKSAKGAKVLDTFVPLLEGGTRRPINPRWNVLVDSYRTSCSKPNLQNLPRKGGARNCFVPRKGYVYGSADYDTIELRALAQCCLDLLGHSAMAEALRADEDLHLNLAADFLGIDRKEAKRRFDEGDKEVIDYRQMMKPANFGFPGGMASDSFVDYAKGYGYTLDRDLAKRIHEQWHAAWPEMRHYFNLIGNAIDRSGEGQLVVERTGFVRGGLRFTSACNHFFQHLTATGAKDALWNVTRECYAVPTSPLYGCRPVFFIHDEIILEIPEEKSAAAVERLSRVMVEVMERWIPDVPIKATPVLMRRWFKGAKAIRVDGKLVPSKPVEIDGKEKWVADLSADVEQPKRHSVPDVVGGAARQT